MAVLDLQFWPAEVLRNRSEPVTTFDPALLQLLENMAETMYVENGIGLAAPQVAVPKRIVVMDVPMDEERTSNLKALINPTIVEKSGEIVYEEGCLSFPGLTADVSRAAVVLVRYQDHEGNWHEDTMKELEAVCIQHEIDHLDGINFVDYLSPLKRKILLRELQKNLAEQGVAA